MHGDEWMIELGQLVESWAKRGLNQEEVVGF